MDANLHSINLHSTTLQESESRIVARQQQLEETLQRLDALETVKQALERQQQVLAC